MSSVFVADGFSVVGNCKSERKDLNGRFVRHCTFVLRWGCISSSSEHDHVNGLRWRKVPRAEVSSPMPIGEQATFCLQITQMLQREHQLNLALRRGG